MEENRRFRNHISIIVERTGGILIALLILFIPSLLENIDEAVEAGMELLDGKGLLVNLGILLLFIIIIAAQVVVWSKTYISIQDNAVIIERNTLNKKKNTIGIRSISNINTEQNLFEMLLGTCKVKLDTNSRSTADSTDVKIVLKKADALWFKQEVMRRMQDEAGEGAWEEDATRGKVPSPQVASPSMGTPSAGMPSTGASTRTAGSVAEEAGEAEDYDVRSDLGDILQHGFFSINVLSVGVLVLGIAGAVGAAAKTLGQPDVTRSLLGTASGILVAGIIVLSALWDTVKDFVRYYDFRAKRRENKIYIRYGFLKKVEYTVPVDKIQALRFRQSFVARLGHRYMAEIINVGMGDDKEEQNSFLILYAAEKKLKERLAVLLPEFLEAAEQKVERQPASVWAAWAFPAAVYTLCVIAGAAVCGSVMTEYRQWILPGAAALELFLALGMILKFWTDGVNAGSRFLKLSRGYFARNSLMVRYRDIQYAEFTQNPLAKACHIKKGELHLLASSAQTTHEIPYFKGNAEEVIKRGMLR